MQFFDLKNLQPRLKKRSRKDLKTVSQILHFLKKKYSTRLNAFEELNKMKYEKHSKKIKTTTDAMLTTADPIQIRH